MAAVDLVVTDLDGTLWFAEHETHPGTLAAWHELERRGIPVLVATGRRVASTRTPLAELGLAPSAVVMNGALALDLATGERFHRQHYATPDARAVLLAFRDAGLQPCVYVDHPDVDVFVGDAPSTHPEHLASLTTSDEADLDEIVASLPVLMFGIMGHASGPLDDARAGLTSIAEAHFAADRQYGAHALTVTPRGLSKWVGVRAYCERASLDPDRVLAIGDGPNDLELLAGAAIAVVPEDAHEVALASADHVVPSTRVGGWAEILDLV
jgi:HAD superfamily hydrolase (TIGR01484 family)